MATLARIELLGIFEDRPQSEFVAPLIELIAPRYGYEAVVEPRLTAGCSFDNLNEQLEYADQFDGVVIGVDGQKMPRHRKIAKMETRCSVAGHLVLWSIASPSIEEWLMADGEALPAALRQLFGPSKIREAGRPGRAHAEQTAKRRLGEWVEGLLGAPALRGGVEYASHVARALDPARIGAARNGDLRELLDTHLPVFLQACHSA